jgi:hypothetical protein
MVCHKRPGRPLKIVVTGPASDAVTDVAWQELKLVQGHIEPWLSSQFFVGAEYMYCKSHGDNDQDPWFATVRTARPDKPDAMQGFHGDPCGIIIDEASGVEDSIFKVLRGAMSDENNFSVMTGNPTRLEGYFHKTMNAERSPWHRMREGSHMNLTTVPRTYHYWNIQGKKVQLEVCGRVSEQYVEDMKDEFGEDSNTYRVRVLGQDPRQKADGVIDTDHIDAAYAREGRESGSDWQRVWGVDPADQGDDDTGLVKRFHTQIEDILTRKGMDPLEVAEWVHGEYEDAKKMGIAPRWVCVDAIGIGAGVVACLRRLGVPVIAVQSGESSPKRQGTKCARVRDYLWWQMRLWFASKAVRLYHPTSTNAKRLQKELKVPSYQFTASQKVEVESKKKIRARGLKSPDVADALAMTFWISSKGAPATSGKKKEAGRSHHHRRKPVSANSWKLK